MSSPKLFINDQEIELTVHKGTEEEKALDITQLRKKTGYVTFDPGLANTAICKSDITYINGEQGILKYRGYPIEELAPNLLFTEISYLLLYGKLPNLEEKTKFSKLLTKHANIHEDMKRFFDGFPLNAHPMATLSSMVTALSAYHPNVDGHDEVLMDEILIKILSKVKTIAAYSYRKSHGLPFIYPEQDLSYVDNFLHMMFSDHQDEFHKNPIITKALNLLLILHADHEQNCSTAAVRSVGSSMSNIFAVVSSGIAALWGPLHGGANQAVIEMLEKIKEDNGDYKKYIQLAKDKNSTFRLMGFGHRIYKNYDPRAKIIKQAADEVLSDLNVKDELLDIAKQLEVEVLKDEYFIQRKLYPNVDFYSGIIYRAIGIPTNMFTVMFALGRIPGWLAHWKEMIKSEYFKISRPRQVYCGEINQQLKK